MKKTAIAFAVAAIAAAPIAAQAAGHGGAGAYGSVRVALVSTDNGTTDAWDVQDEASRFGFKGSEDLGNGMHAFGRWEFRVTADGANIKAGNGLGYAGIGGDFGEVSLGRQWNGFYLKMSSATDQFNSLGASEVQSVFRQSDMVKYTNTFGPVSLEVNGLFVNGGAADTDEIDQTTIAASVNLGDLNLAFASLSQAKSLGDGSLVGFSGSYGMDNWKVAGSLITSDKEYNGSVDDKTGIEVYGSFGLGGGQKVHASFGTTDSGNANADRDTLTVGYQKAMSKRSRVWAELGNTSFDAAGSKDTTNIAFGVRHDW